MSDATKIDADTAQLMRDLEQGLQEAAAGQVAAVHSPADIRARRRGRPVGSVQAETLVPITLRVDRETVERWRASGKGWQTRAAGILAANKPEA
jgi:uncharacterized protein (DUF4415 family)